MKGNNLMSYATLYTGNDSKHWIWVTIHDLGRTANLDWGWVKPGDVRPWASGNYCWGSFYHVRAEVKNITLAESPDCPNFDPPNIFDTNVQVNPQSTDMAALVGFDFLTFGLGEVLGGGGEINSKWIDEDVDGTNTVVALRDSDTGYYWDHIN
jgi:hypothetical protein